jgi:hypothetical protein
MCRQMFLDFIYEVMPTLRHNGMISELSILLVLILIIINNRIP